MLFNNLKLYKNGCENFIKDCWPIQDYSSEYYSMMLACVEKIRRNPSRIIDLYYIICHSITQWC